MHCLGELAEPVRDVLGHSDEPIKVRAGHPDAELVPVPQSVSERESEVLRTGLHEKASGE